MVSSALGSFYILSDLDRLKEGHGWYSWIKECGGTPFSDRDLGLAEYLWGYAEGLGATAEVTIEAPAKLIVEVWYEDVAFYGSVKVVLFNGPQSVSWQLCTPDDENYKKDEVVGIQLCHAEAAIYRLGTGKLWTGLSDTNTTAQ